MSTKLSLTDYWDRLEAHDWYYDFSDDQSNWQSGSKNAAELVAIANGSPEHKKMFLAFRAHKFSGSPWNTEREPKPERPD